MKYKNKVFSRNIKIVTLLTVFSLALPIIAQRARYLTRRTWTSNEVKHQSVPSPETHALLKKNNMEHRLKKTFPELEAKGTGHATLV